MTVQRTASAVMALSLCVLAHPGLAQPQPRPRRNPQPAATAQPATTAQPTTAQPTTAQPTTAAQPVDEIEAEHLRGIELRRQRRDAEARDLFRALYERTHEPRVRAWLAGAEAAAGDWVSGEADLAAALESTTDPWITQHRAELESDLASFRQHVGLLEVISNTPRAEVWLAGARVASLPLERPLKVRAGSVAVELRAEGFVPEVRTVEVAGGMRTLAREVFDLTPRPTVPLAATGAVPPPAQAHDGDAPGVHPLRIVGASLLGLGAVGLGIGTYGMIDYNSQRTNYVDAGCELDPSNIACVGADGSGALTLGIVSLAVGGAFVAGGLTLLLIPLRSTRRATASALTVGAGPGDLGLSLRGAF